VRALLAALGQEPLAESAALLGSALRIALFVALGWLVLRVLERMLRQLYGRLPWRRRDADSEQRAETLVRVIRYAGSAAVVVVVALLVLGELGVSITPLLATAGVAGVAFGFGAQTLVKDCLNGFFLLLEDQIRQGDVVEIAGKGGLVEEITLRYVRLRDYEGAVHFIPAGSIGMVTNRSRGYAYAVIDLRLGYREDADRVFALMREVARAMREDADLGPRILEDIEIAGVDDLGEVGFAVKCRFKVRSLEQWGASSCAASRRASRPRVSTSRCRNSRSTPAAGSSRRVALRQQRKRKTNRRARSTALARRVNGL
jgi:small-conductance mechanosensitive channel